MAAYIPQFAVLASVCTIVRGGEKFRQVHGTRMRRSSPVQEEATKDVLGNRFL